jgi:hypothetical protein
MKKLAAVLLGAFISVTFATLGEPIKEADQKWLDTVEKMAAKGEKRISTPSEVRVNLLKDWGVKRGYSVKATKTETGDSVEVSKSLAQK